MSKLEIETTKLKFIVFPIRMEEKFYNKIKKLAKDNDSDISKTTRSLIRFALKNS